MKKIVLMLFLCGIVGTTLAQEETSNNSFLMFLHGGYGFLPNKTSGLTSYSTSYIDELSSGVIWNAQAYYRKNLFITGLLYSGYTANGSLKNSSDKILTTYVAPQAGMCIPVAGGKFNIAFNGGIGGMWYRNNSVVFQKDRKVTGKNIGVNLGLKGVYNFAQHFGVSLEMSIIEASLSKTNVNYHDKIIKVRYADALHLNQFSLSIGLKYSL